MEIHKSQGENVRRRGRPPKKPAPVQKPISVKSGFTEIKSFEPRPPKQIKISHLFTEQSYLDYIILPTGYMYNRDIQQAIKGDTLIFADKTLAWVHQVLLAPLNHTIVDLLCRKRYGIPITKVLQVWQEGLKANKQDVKIISETECLIVFYEKKEKFGGGL